MSPDAAQATAGGDGGTRQRGAVVLVLGMAQILAWGSTFYLPAVLAQPIADDTGWPFAWVVGGLSLGLLTAGIVSPRIGDAIQRHGGRPVLSLAALFFAAGLLGLALAPSLTVYILAWLVLGLGMGAGLYDAAFATLGRLYGLGARGAITALTLFGGFSSTLCWPLSAFLLSEIGWRGTCAAYAALHLCVLLPAALLTLPREARQPLPRRAAKREAVVKAADRPLFLLTALSFTLSSAILGLLSVHLLTILQARDVALASAVALGALVGPAQVGARAIEMAAGRHHHPIWTKGASALLMALGLGALWAGLPILSLALILYGAGMGLDSIARGTLALSFFGAGSYARIMGRLALPTLVAQALAPLLGALLLADWGAESVVAVLFGLGGLNLFVVAGLFACSRPARRV